MRRIFFISAIAISLAYAHAQRASAQVAIVVLQGTNIIDYRVLNTNFSLLNTGLYALAIGKLSDAPGTNGPWARQSNTWTEFSAQGYPSNWSGYLATQQISWIETVSVLTNLTAAGDPIPDVTGVYTQVSDYAGYQSWQSGDHCCFWDEGGSSYGISASGHDAGWLNASTNPTGEYGPYAYGASGSVSMVYSFVTNTRTWQDGYDQTTTCFQIKCDGIALQSWYASSNVILKPIYGDGSSITGITPAQVGALSSNGGTMGGTINFNLKDATNAGFFSGKTGTFFSIVSSNITLTNLQVTGGSPTTGMVFQATNTLGQGRWDYPVGYGFFQVCQTQSYTYTSSNINRVIYDNINTNTMGWWSASTTNFTPKVSGVYRVRAKILTGNIDATRVYYVLIKKNATTYVGHAALTPGSSASCDAEIFLNGDTDFLEVFSLYYSALSTYSLYGDSQGQQQFSGYLLKR